MIIKLLLITLICTLVVDISGFINSVKTLIAKVLGCQWYQITIKPFDCSLCSSFWSCLIYLLYNNSLTLEYLFVTLLFAALTPIFKELFYTISDLLLKILKLLQ